MHIIIVGINHKVAPVELREKVAFSEECLADAYRHFLANGIEEVVLLSTCNRTEVYAATREQISERKLLELWLSFFGVAPEELEGRFYDYRDQEAAKHLFRVACGLDSMILGETQILGQVKDAYEEAQKLNAIGTYLGELFRRAIKVGKRARTETSISKGAMSVGGAAVELSKHIFANLQTCTVLLIGAGKMGTDTAKALVQAGAKQLLICNRTLSRAQELAAKLGGEVVPFDEMTKNLSKADIVIASTGAQNYVLTKPMVAEAVRQRRYRPLFLVDIAVPRNIEPEAGELDNVFLFDIDDLEQVVREYLEERRKEIPKVEALIEHELRNFTTWLGERKAKPLIVHILKDAQQKTQQTLDELFAELPNLSDAERQAIAAKVRALTMWILDSPLRRIKQFAHSDGIMEAAEKLFAFEEGLQEKTSKEVQGE
ncbi:MAG: glutamyl-tRNA reductase [Armatimonadetes bacterium]|nr:glutamyl-tRNA reductase [Armatimonadota bacterium]MDW8028617.1 glutamyl-tRNA reductase [Armatimonadota bacterium]